MIPYIYQSLRRQYTPYWLPVSRGNTTLATDVPQVDKRITHFYNSNDCKV